MRGGRDLFFPERESKTRPDNRLLLAQAFSDQCRRWSANAGASAASIRVVGQAAQNLALRVAEGHACWPLSESPDANLAELLLASGIVGISASEAKPLILTAEGLLYPARYFVTEEALAAALRARQQPSKPPGAAARRMWQTLFAEAAPGDEQALAVAMALFRRLFIISGGPGTGKTTLVARLLACLLADAPESRIALAAPTGKAAARLRESLQIRAKELPLDSAALLPQQAVTLHRLLGVHPQDGASHYHAGNPLPVDVLVIDEASMLDLDLALKVSQALPMQARLILLGDKDQLQSVEAGAVFAALSERAVFSPDFQEQVRCWTGGSPEVLERFPSPLPNPSPTSGRGAENAGLSLFLHPAIPAQMGIQRQTEEPEEAHLSPLPLAGEGPRERGRRNNVHDGSKNALEPFSLTSAGNEKSTFLENAVIWLKKSYRFDAASPLGHLAAALAEGAGNTAWACFSDATLQHDESLNFTRLREGFADYRAALANWPTSRQMTDAEREPLLKTLFEAFGLFRALCVVRQGNAGVEGVNARLEDLFSGPRRSVWQAGLPYHGQPVLILKNDSETGLANGDVGLALEEEGSLGVWFAGEQGVFRRLPPMRLPAWESAYAMTVHKSQGSEFDRIALILPEEDNPLLTRELVYTAITRARQGVLLLGEKRLFLQAAARSTRREGRLAERLSALA